MSPLPSGDSCLIVLTWYTAFLKGQRVVAFRESVHELLGRKKTEWTVYKPEMCSVKGGSIPEMHRAHASQCSPGWRPGPGWRRVGAGSAFGIQHMKQTGKWFEPQYGGMVLRAGGSENGYTGEGDVAYPK